MMDGKLIGSWKWVNKTNQDIEINILNKENLETIKDRFKKEIEIMKDFIEFKDVIWKID
jgi:hypothetical protein